jgi:hypothetical protein
MLDLAIVIAISTSIISIGNNIRAAGPEVDTKMELSI